MLLGIDVIGGENVLLYSKPSPGFRSLPLGKICTIQNLYFSNAANERGLRDFKPRNACTRKPIRLATEKLF